METPKILKASYLRMIKALDDEIRLSIIGMLASGPLCACDILESFKISQPTLSYHMKLLSSSGLVRSERDGKWMHYSLNLNVFKNLMGFLEGITTPGVIPVPKHSSGCSSRPKYPVTTES